MIPNNTSTEGTFCAALTSLRAAEHLLRESRRESLPVFFEGRRVGTLRREEIRSRVAALGPDAWDLFVWDALEHPAAVRAVPAPEAAA